MSHSTNSNFSSVNFCDVRILSFKTKNGLYMHQSYYSKHKEPFEKLFYSEKDGAKSEERMFDLDGDFIYVKPSTKVNTKDIIITKPIT